jgi:pilus assembly protein CpaF
MMVTMAGFEMPLAIIRSYIASALRLVVHLARLKGGPRKILRISEIVGLKKRRYYVIRDIFGFRQTGVRDGVAEGEFYATGHVPGFFDRLQAAGIELPAELFRERLLQPASPEVIGH